MTKSEGGRKERRKERTKAAEREREIDFRNIKESMGKNPEH